MHIYIYIYIHIYIYTYIHIYTGKPTGQQNSMARKDKIGAKQHQNSAERPF